MYDYPEFWWIDFYQASPQNLAAHALDGFDETQRKHVMESKPKSMSPREDWGIALERDSDYKNRIQNFEKIKFALFTQLEWADLVERFQKTSVSADVDYAHLCSNQYKWNDLLDEYPYDANMYSRIAVDWIHGVRRAKTPEQETAAKACANKYQAMAVTYTIPGSRDRSYAQLWSAYIQYHLHYDANAEGILARDVKLDHLDAKDRAFAENLRATVTPGAIAQRAKEKATADAFARGKVSTDWSYTKNPAPGSGAGNMKFNPSTGTSSYTNSHGEKVYITR